MYAALKSNSDAPLAPPRKRHEIGRWRPGRRIAGAILGAAVGLSFGAAQAAAPVGVYSGNAYGTAATVTVGPLATSFGTTAFLPCPCLGTNGAVVSSNVASVSVGIGGSALRTGAIASTIQTSTTTTTSTNESTSRLAGVQVFNGLVSADAIVSVSRTVATATTARSDDVGASFVNLRIAGQTIPVSVAPNTIFAIPGVGKATLRQHVPGGNGTAYSVLTVNMIAIEVTQANAFAIPIGAKIIIGHTSSRFDRTIPDVLYSGGAYATLATANVASLASGASGATGLLAVGCTGTNGATTVNSIQSTSLGSVLKVGVGRTTAYGSAGVTKTTATIQGLSILNGLISADSVKAVAQTSIIGGRRIRSTAGSGVAGLKVLGLPIPLSIPPNTSLPLPGLGYVVINEQIVPSATSTSQTVVVGLHIFVTQANLLNLPVGANILIARVGAGVEKPKAGV